MLLKKLDSGEVLTDGASGGQVVRTERGDFRLVENAKKRFQAAR